MCRQICHQIWWTTKFVTKFITKFITKNPGEPYSTYRKSCGIKSRTWKVWSSWQAGYSKFRRRVIISKTTVPCFGSLYFGAGFMLQQANCFREQLKVCQETSCSWPLVIPKNSPGPKIILQHRGFLDEPSIKIMHQRLYYLRERLKKSLLVVFYY